MIVDASFTSLGLNYFQTVVPKIEEFRKKFVDTGEIISVDDLADADIEKLLEVWRNRRSWEAAKAIASYLAQVKRERELDDRQAFIYWAKQSQLESWQNDPIGKIKGIGINTFQYLRMMGGVDTVMPDKIVKRVMRKVLEGAGLSMAKNDINFIKQVENIAKETGYKAIELCWMTWLIQYKVGLIRIKKYASFLPKI